MSAAEKIKNLEGELARVRRELSSYRLAAARVGDHLTEIAKLNRELDRSRNEISLILNVTSDAMRLIDRDFNIIWANKSMEDLCGLPATMIEGKKCYEIIRTERCEGEDCLLREVVKGNRQMAVEEEVEVAGEKKDCIITASPFRDGGGEFIGILEDFVDITERKKRETELRDSEEKYRTLFESSADSLFLLTDVFLDCNDQACRLWACEREDIVGHSPVEFSPEFQPDGRSSAAVAAEVVGLALKGKPQRFYWKHLRKDGVLIDTEVSLNRFSMGGEYLLQAAVRDITARKNAEDALRESENFLAGIFSSIQDGLSVLNPDLTIRHTNEVMNEWYRQNCPLEGKKCYRAYHNRNEPCDPCPTLRCFRTGKTERNLVTGLPGSGVEWIELFSFPMKDPDTGELIGVVEFVRDVTRKRQMEEELLKVRKLKSIGLLAGGIAHDFNNILATILGNVSILKLDARPGTDAYNSLTQAETACMRARDLTQQLLTFSSGGAPIKKTILIGDLIRESAGFALHGSNVECRFHIPEDIWPVDADPGQLGQVIHNLVINADQAMPDGGVMEIRAKNRELSWEETQPLPPGRYVRIEVEDEGIGIPDPLLEKIFDPYFTTKQKGSGLGLATVYSIIDKHNGRISVSSGEKTGTVFAFFIPASDQEPADETEESDRILTGSGRILIMDDEEEVLKTVRQIVERLGYRSAGAGSGEEAIAEYKSARDFGDPFQAVILDLTVKGGKGGVETLALLREIDPEVKAIVSSGYSTDSVIADYRREGFQGMAAKPYKAAELSRVLDAVLNSA